jgi:hypothetical protein
MRRIILTFLSLAVVSVSASPSNLPARVSLVLLPAVTLPGLPVGFLLTITNPSAQPEVVGQFAGLKVTNAAGTFSAIGLRHSPTINLPSDQMEKCNASECLTIPPNGQRQLYIRFGPLLVENEFFTDPRLSIPGRYDLQITLSVFNPPTPDMTEIQSDTQTLVIQQPSGADLMVWNLLQQTSGGKGWIPADWLDTSDVVIRQIRATYSTSAYVSWLGAISPPNSLAGELAQFDGALAGNPPSAVRDELLLAKGGALQGWSKYAVFNERNADKAVALADQSRAILSLLYDVALTDYTRKQATDALAHLVTRATALDDLAFYAANDPPAPAFVVPRVECVTKGTGQSFTAHFGYSNPNRVVKVLQIGSDNQVTPAPHEQGQPRTFKPGDHENVFVASSPGGNLKWHLDGSTATATADFPTRCTQ